MIRKIKTEKEIGEIKRGDIVIVDYHIKVGKTILDKKPKAIITASTGYDNIDIDYAKKKRIPCYNIPDYGTETVAEFTLLLILASLRKLNQIYDSMKTTHIDHKRLRGRELNKKTVGVIGTGRIGTKVIELLQPFNVKILAYSRTEKEKLKKMGVTYVPLTELLRKSDIITIHLPLTKETKHLIGEKELKLIKKNAILINTSRGAIIDIKALAKHANHIHAALDVVEGEEWLLKEKDIIEGKIPLPQEGLITEYLIKHPNIIITPHIAYNTTEANRRRWKKAVETAKKIEKGILNLPNRIA